MSNTTGLNLSEYCGINGGGDEAVCGVYKLASDIMTKVDGIQTGVDVFFLLYAGALVFMMQMGFAMLCAGCVRQKNVKEIMLKNLLDACGGAIGFYTFGYGISYGGSQTGTTFIGDAHFGLRGFEDYHSWFFQFAFAATAATIVAGTVAERCKMEAYLCFSFFLSAFVYPVVVHTVWSGNGYLSAFRDDPFRGAGVVDFAGSGVVHTTGGLTALIGAVILGPRLGRFYDKEGVPLDEPAVFQPHSVALQMLGTFTLWFGWYGFNCGSALAIANEDSASTASLAAVTTTLAGAAGCFVCLFTDAFIDARMVGEISYDLTMAMNGALAGLVAVTAGAATVEPWAAIIIGGIGGLVYLFGSKLLIKLRIDDTVDGIPVHLFNGIWGILAAGLFSKSDLMDIAGFPFEHQGWFYDFSDFTLMANQIISLLLITAWVVAIMIPFFHILNFLNLFRVDPLEEEVGIDISQHRGGAYDLTGPPKEMVDNLMDMRSSRHMQKVEISKESEKPQETAGDE